MNILVLGSGGQLGIALKKTPHKDGNRYYFKERRELDICSLDAVMHFCVEKEIEVLINCAAYTQVDAAENDAERADLVNHVAVGELARMAKEVDITLIHISTDYVFGGEGNKPLKEEDDTKPLGVYGKTKYLGEEAIKQSGCKYLIFRTAWLYASTGNNFLQTMLQLTANKEEVKVVFDQVGTPTNAADLARFLVHIIDNDKLLGNEGLYHYTNEGVCSWYDFAWTINKLSRHTCRVLPCYSSQFPSVVRRPEYSVLDKTKVKKTFQIDIPHWMESLEECIKMINNEKL